MLVYNPEFVENIEYAYAVARIRALETKIVQKADFKTLADAHPERFYPLFNEIAPVKSTETHELETLLKELEQSFTETFFIVKSLIIEDEIKRLISLSYDYELLKLLVKSQRGATISIPREISNRSNYSYPVLKTLLENGKVIDTGETIYSTYTSLINAKEISGRYIDYMGDIAYYTELFDILEGYNNPFIRDFYIRKIDAINLTTAFRVKHKGGKRSDLRKRWLPFGSIDIQFLEYSFDLNIESFASKIIFSPFSSVLMQIVKVEDEEEMIERLEKLLDESLMGYLKESGFVTFGIEPILSYLWLKEAELNNLRTLLIAKANLVSAEEIKKHLRGLNG